MKITADRTFYRCTDTAKLVRQALKEAFPGLKFSVRSDVYAGGSSIHVGWTDGPTAAQVEAVVGIFAGSYFDGSIDYKGSRYVLFRGERVSFGADFIFCSRTDSDARVESAIAALWAKRWAGLDGVARPTAEDFRKGRCNGVAWGAVHPGADLRDMIWRELVRRSDRMAKASALASSVVPLGNDGYSPVGALRNVDSEACA